MKKLLSVVTATAVALALLTGAVAVPTLVRPIYYAHITPLGLPEKSGMTQEEIVDAYDEVINYCTGVTDEFSAGILPFSAEGRLCHGSMHTNLGIPGLLQIRV